MLPAWLNINLIAKITTALKKILLLLTTISVLTSFSQRVDIINKADIKNLPTGKIFAFIEPTTDTSQIKFVATILACERNKKSNIENLYFKIREEATKLGANCYKLKSFERGGSNNEAILILECFVATEITLNQNTANHEKNVVFIFGNEREDDEAIFFKVNGETKEIKSGSYFKFTLEPDENLRISIGGFTGESIKLKWEKDKKPAFYSLSGLGISPVAQSTSIGIGVNTGRINLIKNISVGFLLTQLLKQGN